MTNCGHLYLCERATTFVRRPFGANLWIWESPVTLDGIERRPPALKSWGFDIVELPLENAGSWNPRDVRTALDNTGLNASVCIAMPADRDLTTRDAATVRRTQEYLRRAIEAAAIVGSPTIAGPMYAPTGLTGAISGEDRRENVQILAENLQPVLDEARQANVRLAIEPLNRFETSLFNTAEQTMELIDLVSDPRIGLLLDTFHMNIEERDIPAAIRAVGPSIFHFHACGNDRGAPGNGSLPWVEIAAALQDVDYRGSIVIESFAGTNQVIAAAASIWRPLADTQDAIAIEGLRFLRRIFG